MATTSNMSSASEETNPKAVVAATDNNKLTIGSSGDDSDTEDEEVAMNCIGGFRGVEDSDMETTDASSDEEGGDLDDDEYVLLGFFSLMQVFKYLSYCSRFVHFFTAIYRKEEGVVTFVSDHVPIRSVVPLVCPKPTSPNEQGSSPFDEDGPSNPGSSSNDEEEDEESDPGSDNEGQEDDYHLGVLDVKTSASEESPDIELKGILDSIGDILDSHLDESETSNIQYIGVAEDGHRSIDVVPTFPKYKRVLSYNTLFALNREANHSNDTTKRMKRNDLKDWTATVPTTLFSSFSLGSPAMQYLPPLRDESPLISDEDDAELDRQLGSELDEHDTDEERDGSPVPLLTPPASPLTVEVDGAPTTVCEWPSNLPVDCAMLAVNDLDPASLETFGKSEQDQEVFRIENGASQVTSITPLLRSVYVG